MNKIETPAAPERWMTTSERGAHRSGARRPDVPWLLMAIVGAAYAVGSLISFLLFQAATTGAVLFPPAGVTLSALVLTERRRWPWVLGTVAVVEVVIDVSQGLNPAFVCGFALANVAEPLVGASLLRRVVPKGLDVSRRRDLGAFLSCAVLAGPLVGAFIGATTSFLDTGHGWLATFVRFWAGDGLGVLTVGGAVLSWQPDRARPGSPSIAVRALMAALTAAVTVVTFWPRTVPVTYLIIPLLIWLAFRYGVGVVTEAGLAMAITANVMSVAGHGPWAALAGTPRAEAAVLQVYVAVAVLSAWVLAVEIAERDRARSVSRHEAATRRQVEALQEVTAGLATAATSEAIAEVIVRRGIGLLADHGVVGVVAPDGARLRIWRTADLSAEGRAPAEIPLDTASLIATAARTGAAVTAQTTGEIRAYYPQSTITSFPPETHSALAVPARIGSTTVGSLAFGFDTDGAVDADVLAVAQTLAELMAQALLRARLYEEEHEAAHQLQQAFLPVVPDRLPGMDVAGCYRPADQQHDIGGDWYDAFSLPDGRVGFVVGDVVGHDLKAAAAMGRLHSALRVVAAGPHAGPAEVLESLDRACLSIPGAPFATIGYGEYDPVTCHLRYACAGHPPPLLVTADGAAYLSGGRSRPLAVTQERRSEAELTVPPDAMLIWYSDGLVERHGVDLDAGLDQLAATAARLDGADPQVWCDAVMGDLTGGRRLRDDVVLLCLRLRPEEQPALPRPRDGDEIVPR